jgi:hypothetical protein
VMKTHSFTWRERLPPITPASTKCSIAPTISSGAVTVTDGTAARRTCDSAARNACSGSALAGR